MTNHSNLQEGSMNNHDGILSTADQQKIQNLSVAVVGVGGIGGITSILLAKLGFSKITIADRDRFEVSNMNRQLFATHDAIGRFKAEVAVETLKKHNPAVEIHGEVVDIDSVAKAKHILDGADIAISAVDNTEARILVLRAASQLGIPTVVAGPFGWRILVTTVFPQGPDFESSTGLGSQGLEITEDVIKTLRIYEREFVYECGGFLINRSMEIQGPLRTIAPGVNLASIYSINEVVKWATGRGRLFVCPDFFSLDLLTGHSWPVGKAGAMAAHSLSQMQSTII